MSIVCVSTTFIKNQSPLKNALEICEKAGISSIEIGSNHCHEPDYSYVKDFPFEYLVHNYFPVPANDFVVNLASLDKGIHRKSLQHVKTSMDFCSKIGSKLYTFHPGFLSDPRGTNFTNYDYDFRWDSSRLQKGNYERAWEKMVSTIKEIIDYSRKTKVRVAFETEGSLYKKEHLLMQKPEEYERLLQSFPNRELGINLNIGHLNLAANAFGFSRKEFVDQIAENIVAMELSHNNGLEDQHLPLEKDQWYWSLIEDSRFENVNKILEFRNIHISKIIKNIKLIEEKAHAISISG